VTHPSKIRSVKSIVLLVIFIALKLEIAHALSHVFCHHDEAADCDHCFLIVDSKKKHSFNYQSYTYEIENDAKAAVHKPILLLYKNPIVSIQYSTEFFNKPPPTLV